MSNDHQQIGRLAMRQEGENWNAYWALPDSMQEAIWLGGIKMRFVADRARKDTFLDLMRDCMSDMIEERFGVRPSWGGVRTAPEHERSGNA